MNIGIDLGGSHIGAALLDSAGKIINKASVPNNIRRAPQDVINDMVELCNEIIKENKLSVKDIKSVGVSCPGSINNADGIAIYVNTLNFINVPIREEFQKKLDVPFYLENDANCAALAEHYFGSAKGTSSSVTVTLGTGVGGGIIINGKLFNGFNLAGSEMGHMVIAFGGQQCSCGRRGCWEAYSSATALIRQTVWVLEGNISSSIYNMSGGDYIKINAKMIFDAAKQNDVVAEEIIEDYLKILAEGIANVINIIMPEVFVIGGGISAQGDYLLNPIKDLVNKKLYGKHRIPQTEIKIAQLGNDAGLIGAAMLGR